MKKPFAFLYIILVFLTFNLAKAQSEQLYNKDAFNDIIEDGDYFWISSSTSGLIKWNKSGNETTYFNKANSGLLDSRIRCLFKDSQNNIWIGTGTAGLLKFDGQLWTSYTKDNSDLRINYITAINEDNEGNIWVCTYDEGISKISTDNIWTNYYTYNNPEIDPDSFKSIHIAKDGKIYFGWISLVVFDGSSWQTYDYNDVGSMEYIDINEDSEGNIWLASSSHGITMYDGTEFTTYNKNNSSIPTNSFSDMYIDENDNLWLASAGDGLIKFDGANFQSFLPTINGVDIAFINKLHPSGSQSLFLVTYNNLLEFNGTDFISYELNNEPYLITKVNDININNGNVLISTNNSFLYRQNNQWLDALCDYSFSYNSIINIFDTLFVATRNGLRKYDGNNWINYTTDNSNLKDQYVYCVTADTTGTIWLSPKDKGLQTYKEGAIQNASYNGTFCSMTIVELFTDSRGTIWAGSFRQGLSYFKDSIWHTYNIDPDNENLFLYINDFAENNDSVVYVATSDGIAKTEDSTYQIVNRNNTSAIAFDTENNLWAVSYFEDKGDLLVKYSETDSTIFDPYISRIGFEQITELAFDTEGFLWIGCSEAGVLKFDVSNPNHTELVDPTTGIEFVENKKDLTSRIFPNPTTGVFEIKSDRKEIGAVSVNDIQGKVIYNNSNKAQSIRVDLSGFNSGIYLVKYMLEGKEYYEKILLKK